MDVPGLGSYFLGEPIETGKSLVYRDSKGLHRGSLGALMKRRVEEREELWREPSPFHSIHS